MADLDEIMSGQGETAPRQDVQTQEPAQEPRQAQVPGQEPPAGDEDDTDPVTGLRKALDAERGKGRKYKETVEQFERRLEAMQQQFTGFIQAFQAQQRPTPEPAPKKDFFEDPDGFISQAVQPLAQQQEQQREAFSRMMAVDKFGEETVNSAFTDLANRMQRDPSARFDYQRIMASPHPFGALVQWHKQQSAISEIGTDPQAFREKLRAELRAELEQELGASQSQPQPSAAQPSAMPTSFAAARSAGPRSAPQWSGPKPLSELMPR
jgi:hypothetical protein